MAFRGRISPSYSRSWRAWRSYGTAAFHRRRVLPLMAWRWHLFDMRPDEPIEGIWMSAVPLFDEEILRWARETVEGRLKSGGLTHIIMRPSRGYLSLESHAPL